MRVKVHSWLLSAGGNAKKERERTASQNQLRKSETKRKKERGKEINQQNTQQQLQQ